VQTIQNLFGSKREDHANYFAVVKELDRLGNQHKRTTRTFIASPFTAIHLNRDPVVTFSIEEAIRSYRLPDLREAIQEYYYNEPLETDTSDNHQWNTCPAISRHFPPQNLLPTLEFTHNRVWHTLKVQTKSLAEPGRVNTPITIHAEPPSGSHKRDSQNRQETRNWKYGRYDCALFINDIDKPFERKANLIGESNRFLMHS
jgi:hypothetical protein